jgi:hypothetical protein
MAIGRGTSMKGRPATLRSTLMTTTMMMLMVFLIATAMILAPVTTTAHVVLIDPVPRTNNDYLYTFDEGVCQAASCSAFCGDALSITSNALTVLEVVEGSVEIRWKTNVLHEPYQYRIALSMGGDIGFDDNILAVVDNVMANVNASARTAPETGVFATNINIPDSHLAACTAAANPPCVLQLYDLYYFVSCANIVLQVVNGTTTTTPPTTTMVESTTTTSNGSGGNNNNSGGGVGANNNNNGAAATTAGNNASSSSSSSCLTGLVTWIIITLTVSLTVVASSSSVLVTGL